MPDAVRDLRIYNSVLETMGWTPMIRLTRVTRGIQTPVWVKAEIYNPGGSVKDRIGMPIIEKAERDGSLKPGGTIVEGTSGNTGVALAIAAALKGYKCIFTMPDKMSQEKVRLLKVARIPIPDNPALRDAVNAIQLISPRIAGLTLRYGIFIRADCWDDRRLVFHELVHTLQYERLGGFQGFLRQYLYECITVGYPAAPMEQEAVSTTAKLCAP